MTKKLEPHIKHHRQLVRMIRAGKIEYDLNFYYMDCDGLTMLLRGDLLPVRGKMSEWQLKEGMA